MKKALVLQAVHHALLVIVNLAQVTVEIYHADELDQRRKLHAELDAMWSFIKGKSPLQWLWHAMDHHTGTALWDVFGRRKNDQAVDTHQAFGTPYNLLFSDRTDARSGSWGVHQPLRIWLVTLRLNQQV